jgi:hypothetical protein
MAVQPGRASEDTWVQSTTEPRGAAAVAPMITERYVRGSPGHSLTEQLGAARDKVRPLPAHALASIRHSEASSLPWFASGRRGVAVRIDFSPWAYVSGRFWRRGRLQVHTIRFADELTLNDDHLDDKSPPPRH